MAAPPKKNILCLFDVDGTLTPARKVANPETLRFLGELRTRVTTGMVGGSDLAKQREQLGEGVLHLFDYVFPENGLAAYRGGEAIGSTSFLQHLGEARMKEFINFTLVYIAMLDIPIKRGTFIEFRNGMLNVSPIGRNCSQAERDDFERYDHEHKVRDTMVRVLSARFDGFGLKYSIGGQISFDVFPIVRARRNSLPACRTARRTPHPTPHTALPPAPPRRAGIRPFASATSRSSASTKSTSLATRPSPAATTTKSSRRRR
jgi:phosphomannomutase